MTAMLQVLMFGCLPYTLGWLCAAIATSVPYLYASRLLVGVGHAIITTTVYTVEVASKDMRGSYSLLEAVLRYDYDRKHFEVPIYMDNVSQR
jgi:hypothetical protein